MTKAMRMLWVPLAAVVLVAAGCGKGPFVGVWKLDKADFEGKVRAAMEEKMGQPQEGMDEAAAAMAASMMKGMMDQMVTRMIDGTDLTMTINADNTFEVEGTLGGESPPSRDGTWEASGDAIVMSMEGEDPVTATIRDGSMYLALPSEDDGMQLDLKFDQEG